jgi:rhodanese-related sulfurtransferase
LNLYEIDPGKTTPESSSLKGFAMLREVNAESALGWLQEGKTRLIDVREPAEFAAEHIAGSVSLPLRQVSAVTVQPKPGERLVIICASGRRSQMACEQLSAAGLEVFALQGGIAAWRASGGATEKAKRAFIPIERQVLAIAGLLVLSGIVLSFAVHPWFLALSAFVGAGLTFAGLTGFCGMALLLARAPWNQVRDPAERST